MALHRQLQASMACFRNITLYVITTRDGRMWVPTRFQKWNSRRLSLAVFGIIPWLIWGAVPSFM